jgi:hypothetical protein
VHFGRRSSSEVPQYLCHFCYNLEPNADKPDDLRGSQGNLRSMQPNIMDTHEN